LRPRLLRVIGRPWLIKRSLGAEASGVQRKKMGEEEGKMWEAEEGGGRGGGRRENLPLGCEGRRVLLLYVREERAVREMA